MKVYGTQVHSVKGTFMVEFLIKGILINTVFIRIVAAATINFSQARVRLLIEGGSYSRAALIILGNAFAQM